MIKKIFKTIIYCFKKTNITFWIFVAMIVGFFVGWLTPIVMAKNMASTDGLVAFQAVLRKESFSFLFDPSDTIAIKTEKEQEQRGSLHSLEFVYIKHILIRGFRGNTTSGYCRIRHPNRRSPLGG